MFFYTKSLYRHRPAMAKILLVMRLIIVLITAAIMQVSAAGYAQKVTLVQKNAALSSVLDEIRKQTGYDFVYSDKVMNTARRVSLNIKNAELKDALEICFKDQPLGFEIEDKMVIIKPKEKSFLEGVVARFQTIDVRGKVVDSLGNGLAGATVSVKGGKRYTSTNAGGNFVIRIDDDSVTLVVSYLGFITKEFVAGKEFNYIQLDQSSSKLDEVQIQAYGLTSKRLGTGNISTLKDVDIAKQPVSNPLYALQGRIAGLQVTPTSGLAGGAVILKVRGQNSLSSQTPPLILIDGLPMTNNIAGLGHAGFVTNGLNQLSALNFINPSDIESIDVLKDADATSIYGSRGANGVILITTKKGKNSATSVNLNTQNGFGEIPKKMSLLKTEDYLSIRHEAYTNIGLDGNNLPLNNNQGRADVAFWDPKIYTDWQKELIGNRSKYNDVQFSVTGGNQNIQYLLGSNYRKETTVFPGRNADEKINVHMSLLGTSNNQRFKTTISATYLSDNNTLPGIDYTERALKLSPNAPSLYNMNGDLNWELMPSGNRSWDNPLSDLYRTYNATVSNLTSAAVLSYSISPTLNVKTSLGYSELRGNSFRKTAPFAGRAPDEYSDIAIAAFNQTSLKNLSIEPQIQYADNFAIGTFNFLLGASFQGTLAKDQFIESAGATSDALLENFEAGTSFLLRNNSSEYKYAAIFSRLNYNWKEKYLVSLNARRDASSRFGPGNQIANFYSIGSAWIFTKEKFMEQAVPIISFGKLRFSYGTSGNDGIGDYRYLERYELISGALYGGGKGARTLGLFNDKYSWEITKKMEFGTELGFFKDRFILSAAYFVNRSGNQLLSQPLPTMAGPGAIVFNRPALIQNSGFEFSVNSENLKTNNFSWSTAVNFTSNRNKLLSYPDVENSPDYRNFVIGQPFTGIARVYRSAGIDPETGKYRFIDVNGSLTFNPEDNSRLDGGKYVKIMTDPKFFGGLSNTFRYKSLSLDVFIQFVKQNGINPLASYLTIIGTKNNLPEEFRNRWQNTGDKSFNQKVFALLGDEYKLAAEYQTASDFGYVDASFLRLKNVSLSYSLPRNLLNKVHLNAAGISASGQNIITWTKYKGLDPETQSLTSIPPLRVITLGIQVGL